MNAINIQNTAKTYGAPLLAICICIILSSTAVAATGLETLIYKFNGGSDGQYPTGGLIADSAGNLYGATIDNYALACSPTCGTVFQLSPPASGNTWVKTTLHSFGGGNNDGSHPVGGLVLDTHGNLYGATWNGGTGNQGVIYRLSPPATSGAEWTETILYMFQADGSDGAFPNGDMALDADGNVYGTTAYGGSSCGCGVVFQLSPPATSGGLWTESLIHIFNAIPNEGAYPIGGLTFDKTGALYGVTSADFLPDGTYDPGGTVFELKRQNGVWTRKIIFDFGTDPALFRPGTSFVIDRDGNLWGTTYDGGWYICCYAPPCYVHNDGCGGVYELVRPTAPGLNWSFNLIFPFWGPAYGKKEGLQPQGRVSLDSAGNVYGTTYSGGLNGLKNPGLYAGTVFQLQPPTKSGGAWSLNTLHAFAGTENDGKYPSENMVMVKGVFYGTTGGGGSLACQNGCGTVFRLVVTP